MAESWRAYVQMATEIGEDLMSSARSNRGLLLDMVRGEVDRVVSALGLAGPGEIAELRRRIARLERQVEALQEANRGTTKRSSAPAPARKTAARKRTQGEAN